MAFVAWSGWPWLFFMTYWNNTSSSYLPVCVFVHTADPFPVMKTWFSCDQILTAKSCPLLEGILLSLQGKPVMKTGFPCLIPVIPCMGLQCILFNKMLWRTPWFIQELVIHTANTANIFDETELPYVQCCINSRSVFHHGFLIDHLITIWTLIKKLKIARTKCLSSDLYPPELIKRVQYVKNKKLHKHLYFFIAQPVLSSQHLSVWISGS